MAQFIPDQSSWYDFFFGKPSGVQQIDKYNPQQQEAFKSLLGQGLEGLQSGNVNLGPIEQRAQKNFQSKTIPSIAERFTSQGGNNRLGNPAFSSELGNAGADLEQGLAGLRYDKLFQMLGQGLTPQFENLYQQEQPGFLENTYKSAEDRLMKLLPLLLGGGFGGGGGNGFSGGGSQNVSLTRGVGSIPFPNVAQQFGAGLGGFFQPQYQFQPRYGQQNNSDRYF